MGTLQKDKTEAVLKIAALVNQHSWLNKGLGLPPVPTQRPVHSHGVFAEISLRIDEERKVQEISRLAKQVGEQSFHFELCKKKIKKI